MSDEIKEILDNLKDIDKTSILKNNDAKMLLDYITNLQEENKRLKKIINENTIQVQDKNGNYQECNINVIKMYNDMQDDIENLIKKKEDYKSRNEKAIEYINENSAFMNDDEWEVFNKKELLNILNGGDENGIMD